MKAEVKSITVLKHDRVTDETLGVMTILDTLGTENVLRWQVIVEHDDVFTNIGGTEDGIEIEYNDRHLGDDADDDDIGYVYVSFNRETGVYELVPDGTLFLSDSGLAEVELRVSGYVLSRLDAAREAAHRAFMETLIDSGV